MHLIPGKIYFSEFQGSVLGPLLINIYLNDLLFALKEVMDISNFAEDTMPLFCNKSTEHVFKYLEENFEFALDWFRNNYMLFIAYMENCNINYF